MQNTVLHITDVSYQLIYRTTLEKQRQNEDKWFGHQLENAVSGGAADATMSVWLRRTGTHLVFFTALDICEELIPQKIFKEKLCHLPISNI